MSEFNLELRITNLYHFPFCFLLIYIVIVTSAHNVSLIKYSQVFLDCLYMAIFATVARALRFLLPVFPISQLMFANHSLVLWRKMYPGCDNRKYKVCICCVLNPRSAYSALSCSILHYLALSCTILHYLAVMSCVPTWYTCSQQMSPVIAFDIAVVAQKVKVQYWGPVCIWKSWWWWWISNRSGWL